jgi:hypothetical protein
MEGRLTPMSTKRDRKRRRSRAAWEVAKRRELGRARKRIGLDPDETIPDDVLLAEVDGYLPPHTRTWEPDYRLEPRHQWFGFRLIGIADTEPERNCLAQRVLAIRSGRMPLGLGPGGAPRRSPAMGRRRNRRRSALSHSE